MDVMKAVKRVYSVSSAYKLGLMLCQCIRWSQGSMSFEKIIEHHSVPWGTP